MSFEAGLRFTPTRNALRAAPGNRGGFRMTVEEGS